MIIDGPLSTDVATSGPGGTGVINYGPLSTAAVTSGPGETG